MTSFYCTSMAKTKAGVSQHQLTGAIISRSNLHKFSFNDIGFGKTRVQVFWLRPAPRTSVGARTLENSVMHCSRHCQTQVSAITKQSKKTHREHLAEVRTSAGAWLPVKLHRWAWILLGSSV